MTVPLWAAELAGQFWRDAGETESFPRSLRGPVARALPLAVVSIPGLTLDVVRDWLRQHTPYSPCVGENRALRACLFAWWGSGFVFLDGTDPDDEQRYSLGHEVAHFLRDYLQPRRLAQRRLGRQIADVLDGLRPPTAAERLQALTARVPLGYHYHLMQRDGLRQIATQEVAVAEQEADRLAYELLAPAEAVGARFLSPAHGPQDRAHLVDVLRQEFGLPLSCARAYGDMLLPDTRPDLLLERLRCPS